MHHMMCVRVFHCAGSNAGFFKTLSKFADAVGLGCLLLYTRGQTHQRSRTVELCDIFDFFSLHSQCHMESYDGAFHADQNLEDKRQLHFRAAGNPGTWVRCALSEHIMPACVLSDPAAELAWTP